MRERGGSYPKLTEPRWRGFRVLVAEQNEGRLARRSNETHALAGCIYWQVADWLVATGLATLPSGRDWLALTERGTELAAAAPCWGVPDDG